MLFQDRYLPAVSKNDTDSVSTPTADLKSAAQTSRPTRIVILPQYNMKSQIILAKYKVVCYYTNWAWYRPGLGKYGPEDMDPSLCTHVVYGFAVLSSDGQITAHDSWADYDNREGERVVEYNRYGVKVSLALGGCWNDSQGDKYSKLVNVPAARARFVTHALQFIEKYNFNGLDSPSAGRWRSRTK